MPDVQPAVDGQPWPTAQFARQSPTWAPSGVIGTPAASSSVGDMALGFDVVAGLSVTVKMVPGRANARGFLYERTDANWVSGATGTQPSPGSAPYTLNTASNPRIDRLVLRRNLSTQKVYPFVIQGTPAAAPAIPALTQVENGIWDTPLHRWQLAGFSSTTVTNMVDERVWVDPGGDGRKSSRLSIAGWVNGASSQSYGAVNNYTLPGQLVIDPKIGPFVALVHAAGIFTGSSGASGSLRLVQVGTGVVASNPIGAGNWGPDPSRSLVSNGDPITVNVNLEVLAGSITAYSDATHSFLEATVFPL